MIHDISITLDKLFIPLIEIPECIIDLSSEGVHHRLKYPKGSPVDIASTENFIKDNQQISITVMLIMGKKYKKIARGEISISKKTFPSDKNNTEKWINLTLFQNQLEAMGQGSDVIKAELNTGKILMTLTLLTPINEITKRFLKIHSSEITKKEKPKKANEINENANEDSIKKLGQFEDNLSEISISIVELSNDGREDLNLNEISDDDYVNKLKDVFNADYQSILPKDIDKLKQMNEMLYNKTLELSKMYNETLTSLTQQNEQLRQQGKDFYDKYKIIKEQVYKARVDLKHKNNQLKSEMSANCEQSKSLFNDIQKLKTEIQMFKGKMKIEDVKKEETAQSVDINSLINILNKVNGFGYDVLFGCGLSDDERMKLKQLLNTENDSASSLQNEKAQLQDVAQNGFRGDIALEAMQDDVELGNKIVILIERDVNYLFMKKLIDNIKIDQVNAITYTFTDTKGSTKQVMLNIGDGVLNCVNGGSFNAWLIQNFGI